MSVSDAIKAKVLAVLPDFPYGLAPYQVHQLVGSWSLVTIRHALRELVGDGRVGFGGPNGGRAYFRKQQS